MSYLRGKVFLIGAGPGDPGLLTLKGRDVLNEADVIVYDYLVNPVLLNHAKAEAETIYVGKKAGQHTLSQEAINELLINLGREGKLVARLKGGDPFVFGRGGEEAQALREAGISFEIIPGISSAVAVPAYAGIPVTHRDYSSSFTVITGHEDPQRSADESRINWAGLVATGGTLVFMMGVGQLGEISARLVQAGQSELTPVAVVQWGTTWQQKVVTGNLSNIAELVQKAGLKPPAVIVVGEVVNLQASLQWFNPSEFPILLDNKPEPDQVYKEAV